MDKSETTAKKEFLKSSNVEHDYVPGSIFYSRKLHFYAHESPKTIDRWTWAVLHGSLPYYAATLKKHNAFFIEPGKPAMLLKKEISEDKNQNEYWQVLFEEKIGWIGVKNLSEFRHLKKNKRAHQKQV